MKHKLLSILTALALILSLCPVAAFAAEGDVASVTVGDTTTYYEDIQSAWEAANGKTATLTLLKSADLGDGSLSLTSGDVTLEMADGVALTSSTQNAVVYVKGGKLTLNSGTVKNTYANSGFGLQTQDGILRIEGGTVSGTSAGVMASGGTTYVTDGTFTGTGSYGAGLRTSQFANKVQISGGTFTGGSSGVYIHSGSSSTLADLLEEGYAFKQGDVWADTSGKSLTGTVTVAECPHTGATFTPNTDGTHTLNCSTCGLAKRSNCTYKYQPVDGTDTHKGTCVVCGDEKTEAHTIGYTAEAAGRVITVKEGCTTCGYGDTLGTVTFTIPKLVYGDLSGVISADISGQLLEKMKVTLQLDEHHILWLDAQYGNTLSDLAENTVLDAGEHTLRVAFILKETGQEFEGCGLTFTVDPDLPVDPKPPVDPDPGPDEPDPPVDPGQVETRMEVEEGISQVPEGLKNIPALDSAAKLEAAMRTAVTQTGVPAQNTAVYDVKLMVSTDGGQTWVPATEANFPAAGLTIALPYPAGTDSSYTFTVVHMFTTAAFGRTPGNTESPAVTNTEAGLRFTVTGLSPISVGWKEKEPDRPVTPGRPSGGGGGGSGVSTYRVTVEQTVHGKVASNRTYAPEDSTVTLTVTPDSGCVLDALTVTDSRGNAVKLTDKGDGRYTFSMPGRAVTVKASFKAVRTEWSSPYSDVAAGAWYYDAARYVTENGLMKGVGGGHFAPNDTLTRAQLVQILYNRAGRPAVQTGSRFSDVGPGAWYADAIAWAASEKIVSGVGGGRFAPNDPITREQLATTLWRYAGRPAAGGTLSFPDADQAAGYALDALRWAVENGVINGKSGGILDPKGLATRAQTAQMLMNLLKDD